VVKAKPGGWARTPSLAGINTRYSSLTLDLLLVEMLEPYQGRVYDPCCGSSGMFVQSVEFIRAHAKGNGNQAAGKARADISIYGQESNYTTWRLAQMNLAIRGIEGQIAQGDTDHYSI
jgi:type I restriction enzyme M protein